MESCTICNRDFKSKAGLLGHERARHGTAPDKATAPASGVTKVAKSPSKPETVLFTSPKAKSLTVIVKPEYWGDVNVGVATSGENITKRVQIPGKTAQFEAGLFRTDDPEIVDFLENKYNEPRFPVLSTRVTAAWVK